MSRVVLACLAGLWLALAGVGAASAAPAPTATEATPYPLEYRLVNDGLQVLTIKQNVDLTRKLQALEKRNGTQIVFMSVESAGPQGVQAYGAQLLEKLPLGNNGDHNGVFFLLAGNGQFYIFTGAGIAGALPDARLGRIIHELIEPLCRQDKYAEGVLAGIDALIQAAAPETSAATAYHYDDATALAPVQIEAAVALGLIGLLYAGLLLRRRRQRSRRARRVHGALLAIIALGIVLLLTYRIAMVRMLEPVRGATAAQVGNRFVEVDPRRLPLKPATLAERGVYTVVYFHDAECGACARLDTDLADFLAVRPDVAVRKIRIEHGAAGYAEATRNYQLRIYQAPFVLIYGKEGQLVAADDGIQSAGFDTLQTWIWQALMRASAEPAQVQKR